MFDVAPTELLVIAAVAVAVIPSKDLPKAMRFAGHWMGKARGMARHFRSGVDEMIRQSELEEMEKKWREENERIMREHPLHDAIEHPVEPVMTPLPAPVAGMEPRGAVPGHAVADPAIAAHSASADAASVPPAPVELATLPQPGTPDGEAGRELPLDPPPAEKSHA
ncbi:twin-arginine translocase subunit TatB [uncultured Sphingomonas sp.]|uniref:twin-arginine translocase subunit TatB n=1 Tax=uncultured Sphingomonas sp. TaxID=158754 RepID=UPI0025E00276|nr:twin-arginine translocase subunit TatB [uncultured Sphingomonas sp.]